MNKLILFFIFFFIYLTGQPYAQTHMDLVLDIDLNSRLLKVSGQSNGHVHLPDGTSIDGQTPFTYNWPLPPLMQADNWQGGAFVDQDNLYLPAKWYPASDDLVTFTVQVSSPLITILPGRIEDEKITPNKYSARFVMSQPSEGIPLFAGHYKIAELQGETVKLRTYFYDGMEDLNKTYLQTSARHINRFERQIGPFPFSQFNIIAAPIPAGYGFSGLTYMGANVLHLPFIPESSLGHEILHNYWGNGVFPDYKKGNWAEGLTTYMADYINVEQQSPEKAREMRLNWLRDFNALPEDQDQPVNRFISKHGQASQVVGYHKVAFIFHMLRQTLGDQKFFNAIRQFWMDQAFKTASWQDLENSFSKVSTRDLSTFFTQWVTQKGAPRFTSISARARHLDGENWTISATVMQDTPAFETILPVQIGNGERVVNANLHTKERISASTLTLPTRPMALSLDPDFNIFRKLATNEAPPILRDIMLSNDLELVTLVDNVDETPQVLASRLSEGTIKAVKKATMEHPLLVISLHQDHKKLLQNFGLAEPDFPEQFEGTTRVWVGSFSNGIPYGVIELKDSSDIKSLLRPLPHYGKYAKLIFDGPKAVYKSSGQTQPISIPIH